MFFSLLSERKKEKEEKKTVILPENLEWGNLAFLKLMFLFQLIKNNFPKWQIQKHWLFNKSIHLFIFHGLFLYCCVCGCMKDRGEVGGSEGESESKGEKIWVVFLCMLPPMQNLYSNHPNYSENINIHSWIAVWLYIHV